MWNMRIVAERSDTSSQRNTLRCNQENAPKPTNYLQTRFTYKNGFITI